MAHDVAAGLEASGGACRWHPLKRFGAAGVEAALPYGLFAVAFAAYFQTFVPDACPAASDGLAGVGRAGGHPLWQFLARALGALPAQAAGLGRLLGALCGGLAVAGAYRLARRFFQELVHPQLDMRLAPEPDQDDPCAPEPGGEGGESLAVVAGAAACALTLAFSVPFWLAATSLSERLVEVLLLLAVADLLLRLAAAERLAVGLAAVCLCGACAVESPSLLVLLPVALALVIRVAVRSDDSSEHMLLWVALAVLAGGALLFGLWLALARPALGGAEGPVLEGARLFLRAYGADFLSSVGCAGFFFAWFVPALALFFSLMCVRNVVLNEPELGPAGWALLALTTGVALCAMLNPPDSAGAFVRSGTCPPAVPSLMLSLVVGCAFVSWVKVARALSSGARREDEEEERRPHAFLRAAGFAVSGTLALALLYSPAASFADLQAQRRLSGARERETSGEARGSGARGVRTQPAGAGQALVMQTRKAAAPRARQEGRD